jgi:hypothetical protein
MEKLKGSKPCYSQAGDRLMARIAELSGKPLEKDVEHGSQYFKELRAMNREESSTAEVKTKHEVSFVD